MAHTLAATLGWLAATAAAAGMALVAPDESTLLGKLPPLSAKRLDEQTIALPQELPSGRTLALVAFARGQREEIQSWIEGLQLQREPGIAWVKLRVLPDPGDDKERRLIERQLLAKHADAADRTRHVSVFTDRDAFVRSAGLSGTGHASVLVVDRAGNVLARAEGPFDKAKAEALRETVLAQND